MEAQLDIFDPAARATDPDTSWDAARSVRLITAKQAAVRDVLGAAPSGLTDEELAARYVGPHQSPSGLRTRRKELVDLGLVRDSGRRAQMETGRMAIVWEVA